MKRLMALIALAMLVGPAGGQERETSTTFTTIELHRYGKLEGTLDTPVRRISEGVDMTLRAETPEDNLDIQCKAVEFIYAEGEKYAIDHVIFEGDVIFEHRDGVVRAEKVTIDFNTRKAKFTGNPRVENDQIRGVEAAYITLDLDTHEFVMGPGKIKEIHLTSADDRN